MPASTNDPVSTWLAILRGVKDPIDAAAQDLADITPQPVANWFNDAARWGNRQPIVGPWMVGLGMTPATPDQVRAMNADGVSQYEAARAASGATGIDWGRIAGNVAGTLAFGPGAPIALIADAQRAAPPATPAPAPVVAPPSSGNTHDWAVWTRQWWEREHPGLLARWLGEE